MSPHVVTPPCRTGGSSRWASAGIVSVRGPPPAARLESQTLPVPRSGLTTCVVSIDLSSARNLARRLLDADAAMRRGVFIGNLMVTRKKRVVGRLIHFFSAPVRSTSSGHAS